MHCGMPQILCRFGVNALSSKAPNAIKLSALGRLIEGPGRPNKQRFAIPTMAQGEQKVARRVDRNRTAARRPRCFVSGGQLGRFHFPVDRIDRPGDALHSVAFLLLATLFRRFLLLPRRDGVRIGLQPPGAPSAA
jgi:hypothetical protein